MDAFAGSLAFLFLVSFGAATLLPLQSEAVLGGLVLAGYEPVTLVAVASAGNIAGSSLNWWLGTQLHRFSTRRWFPVRPAQLERARRLYARYGRYTLLGAWLPVVGDPLTLIAGMLGERFRVFLLLVAIGKTARYALVAWTAMQLH